MKILVFSPYYPPHIGGLESHADEFNKYLSQKGVDITVFTPRLPKNAPEFETKYNGVKIIRFPAWEIIPNYPLPKFWLLGFWRLFFALFKEKYDAVVSRTRFFNTSLLTLAFAKLKKVQWLHIEHGSDFVRSGGKFATSIAKIYDYTFGKLVIWSADKVVANSRASADFCQKLVKNMDCEVIYRGVEIEKIENARPALEVKAQFPNDTIIAFIGRLIDGKGVQDLIEAVKDIKENYKLFIIGEGPQRNDLEKLTEELELNDHVLFFGHKNFEDAMGLLKISDIFVNPSHTEGLPTSVIEAALCKKAIIASNVGGTPEIITNQKSGYLIEPRDTTSLREKIQFLIEKSTLREALGNNAYEEVKNRFAWEASIGKYFDILKNIGNSRKKIFFLSSRHGGPYKQHKIIGEELKKHGYQVEHRFDLWGLLKAHFIYGRNRYIITNVPLLIRFSKKNFIFNIKGNYTKERSIFKNPLGYLYGLNKFWSEKIVLPSQYLKDVLKIENAIIIPNAVSEKLIAESQKEKLPNTSNKINLIMVTMFGFREKSEGALKVIECLSKVKTDKDVTLNIFGSGTFEDEIKERAAKIKTPDNIKIFFRGYAKNIDEEYRKADIFVYWSDLDVMPNVFLEAMAFGLPIIANDFPSFKYILGKQNFISDNPNQLSDNLEKLIYDPELIKISSKINRYEIKKYSLREYLIVKWRRIISEKV